MNLLNANHLEVLRAELVPVHINGRQEDGLHLVVSQLIGGQMRGDQHLRVKMSHGKPSWVKGYRYAVCCVRSQTKTVLRTTPALTFP